MPEDLQDEVIPQSVGASGRKVKPGMIAAVVALIALAIVGVLLLRGPRAGSQRIDQQDTVKHDEAVLDIPTLEVATIDLSIPLEESGAQRKSLRVGVEIRFVPADEGVDIKTIQKEFIPRVTNLEPEFRDIIIKEMSTKDYGALDNSERKEQMLKNFREDFNSVLRSYGMLKKARVEKVMWKEFVWM